jgi:hypothetical protein
MTLKGLSKNRGMAVAIDVVCAHTLKLYIIKKGEERRKICF